MVTVVESDLEALLCGRRAAAQWNSVEVRFERGDVEGFLKRAAVEGRRFDVIVANPPRGGMEAPVTRRIAEQQPGRIVLVSCDPATLARDTRRLVDAGYIAERAFPVDMFPQTVHVETVLSLRRGT